MGFEGRNARRAVFLHGAGGGAWEWIAWARVFEAGGWRVSAPELQPAPGGLVATGLFDYRAQVEALAGAGGAVLVGASLGGWLTLAASAAVRPAARILVNPVPPAGVPGWPVQPQDFPGVVPWGSAPDFAATRRALPDGDHEGHLLAHRNWRDESGRALAELHAGAPVTPYLSPTLVLASERDADVPPETGRALAERLEADFILLPGASHLGPLLGASSVAAARLALEWLALARGD